MEGTEANFSVEQICGDFGLNDVSLDYRRETKAGTFSLKMFQENYEAQIQAGNLRVPVSKLRMLVAAKWRQFNWEAQREKIGSRNHGQRGGSTTPKKGTLGASLGRPPGPPPPGGRKHCRKSSTPLPKGRQWGNRLSKPPRVVKGRAP